MMKCGVLNVRFLCLILISPKHLIFVYLSLEALVKITGAYPAFMRPRKDEFFEFWQPRTYMSNLSLWEL